MSYLNPLDLQRGPGADLLAQVRQHISPALAALATRFARTFIVASPWAPGFCCVGGEVTLQPHEAEAYGAPRLSVTGSGESLDEALISCLGEAADRLSQVERPGDTQQGSIARAESHAVTGGWIAQASKQDGFDWVSARDLATGIAAALPADLCIRRPSSRRAIEPAGALSAGVAAGPDLASAAVRATLELIERDAAALWWLGGTPPKAFPLEHAVSIVGAKLIEELRQGCADRHTLLLDIATDLGIPAVAAVSLNREGHGLACGLAARLFWEEAARAAMLEMCQMELAAPLAEAKRSERGDAALNDIDWRHLQRASFAAAESSLIYPNGVSDAQAQSPGAADDPEGFAARLGSHGIRLFVVDLSRPDIGVAVARMVSPDLQPYTTDVATDRLRRCRAAGKERPLPTAAIPIL